MSAQTERMARELRRRFTDGARTGQTGSHYTPISAILASSSVPYSEVVQVYYDYERFFGRGSFRRDMEAFLNRVPPGPGGAPTLRPMWTARLAQGGINLSGAQGAVPVAVPYTGSPQQMQAWHREMTNYFQGAPAAAVTAQNRITANWALRHWSRIWIGGNLRSTIELCGFAPQNNSTFQASFSILSQNPQARRIGTQQGAAYFRQTASQIRQAFNGVMQAAQRYQEVYSARCHPGHAGTNLRGSPVDTENVQDRLRAWEDLQSEIPMIPVLTQQEGRRAYSFRALATCWESPPRPFHTCGIAAGNAGVNVGGGSP